MMKIKKIKQKKNNNSDLLLNSYYNKKLKICLIMLKIILKCGKKLLIKRNKNQNIYLVNIYKETMNFLTQKNNINVRKKKSINYIFSVYFYSIC